MKKRILFVVAQRDWRDEELLVPQALLTKRGGMVTITSTIAGPIVGKGGTEAIATVAVAEASIRNYDAIVFVGGSGSAEYFDDPVALKLASECYHGGKVTAAICAATSILANAGVLMGKQCTGYYDQEQNIINHGGDYTGLSVEVDGSVVTGRDAAAAAEFAERIAYLLEL